MNSERALQVIAGLKEVESSLNVVQTMMIYVREKTDLARALLEIKTMSEWSQASVKAACGEVMGVLGTAFEEIMIIFNENTEADVDQISIEPFKARFDEEIREQEGLRAAALHVMEMANRVAMALGIPIPAPSSAVVEGKKKPTKKFGKALKNLIFEEVPGGTPSVKIPVSWLTEAVLRENDPSVQKLALLDDKLTQTKSVDALKAFADRFMMTSADLAEVVLDVVSDARSQIEQSDAISATVANEYNVNANVVMSILEVREETNQVNAYVSGR